MRLWFLNGVIFKPIYLLKLVKFDNQIWKLNISLANCQSLHLSTPRFFSFLFLALFFIFSDRNRLMTNWSQSYQILDKMRCVTLECLLVYVYAPRNTIIKWAIFHQWLFVSDPFGWLILSLNSILEPNPPQPKYKSFKLKTAVPKVSRASLQNQ